MGSKFNHLRRLSEVPFAGVSESRRVTRTVLSQFRSAEVVNCLVTLCLLYSFVQYDTNVAAISFEIFLQIFKFSIV
jgi:hypothetical protein